ncbi:MAG: O-antigen ligase family protein [Lachnospiraceae bacterium]|nr:O-antigen ligase family protein [Lachnospiraceae bacterium]
MITIILLLSTIMLFVDLKEFGGEHAKKLFSKLAPKNWKTTFCLADLAVIIFWIICLISTLQSKYLFEAFWGNEGRYSGLFLITLYVAFYFIISRFWKAKSWILQLFLISGMIMCYIGITDYFQMDILNFRGKIKPEQSTMFTSTVGNINTYTAYVAILMGFATALFATAKNKLVSVWYYICMVVTFFAIIMGCSDNAYLAIGALFAFLPFMLFRNRQGVLRYLIILATFMTVIQCIDWINQKFANVVIGLDSLFNLMVNFGGLMIIVIGLWILAAAFYFFVCKGKNDNPELGRRLVYCWTALMMFGILVVCFMLFDANVAGNGTRYGSLGKYLVFSDAWGTNRGYIWRKSFELYQEFPIMKKIFGYGPDTFGILTVRNFRGEMTEVTGQVFDSAHNEYLQFLVTIGLFGVIAYMTFLISSCYRMIKNNAKNPLILGCLCAVLCYAFQAIVNLNLPIATPMMWLLLSAGVSMCKDKKLQ